MENKIKLNVEEQVLRISIPTDNGTIVVNNPSDKLKNELIGLLVNCIVENKDFDERKLMQDLIDDCTNVEFEGDIFEATNLTHEAKMITNEILMIFQEIMAEAYQIIKIAMQQAKNEMLQNEILNEKDKIIEKAKEIQEEKMEEIKEEVKEEVKEEIPHKTVRKPQRSRGRVNRK